MFLESVLTKRGLRSDTFWARRFAYTSALRYVPFFLDTFALIRSQWWPRERLEHLQDQRLSALFQDARRIPYWRNIFQAARVAPSMLARKSLSRLPVTSKKELNSLPLVMIADESLLLRSDPDHTSGSTGRPLHFYQDWGASLRSFAVTERIFHATGPRYPIVYMRARPRNGFTFYRHIWFFLRSFSSIPYRIRDFEKLARRLSGGFTLYAYASWVVELVRKCEEADIRLPLKAVMTAGEHLSPQDRSYLERATGAPVFTLYASREVGFLGFECERHVMHLNEEWALVEIVDAEGRVLPLGEEGRVVVTAFDNRVMPFIRYDIGDRGVISDTPCVCGRTLRTIEFKGRTVELMRLDDGRTVSLLDIAYALGAYRESVLRYQIVQKATMLFLFRIVPGPKFDSQKEYIERMMIRLLHPRVQIRWEVVDSIPETKSGKAAYFIREAKEA